MFDVKEIGKHVSVAICALLFGSTMILSAVGPARADTTAQAVTHEAPTVLRYMA